MKTLGRAWSLVGWALAGGLVVAACAKDAPGKADDDSDDGTTTSGSGASSSATGGSGGAGGATSGGGGTTGTCDASPWTDDATCTACLETNCCFALNACEPNSDCLAFDACVAACGADLGCASSCVDDHETGVIAVEALAACNADTCDACAELPATSFGCETILEAHQGSPYAACAEMNCCDEVLACAADEGCNLAETLTGDSGPSPLLTCIYANCGS